MDGLTLTGATLLPSKEESSRNGSGETAKQSESSKMTTGAAGAAAPKDPLAADGPLAMVTSSHANHNHGGGHKSCCSPKPVEKPSIVLRIPAETLVAEQDADQLYQTLHGVVRMGNFDNFHEIVTAWKKAADDVSIVENALRRIDQNGYSLLHWAAKREDEVRFVEYLTDYIAVDLKSQDETSMTPLHWACTQPGALPLIRALLSAQSKKATTTATQGGGNNRNHQNLLHVEDSAGCPPLLIAAQHGQVEAVAYLVKKGADLNATDHNRDSATHWAAYKGSETVLGLLSYYNTRQLLSADTYGQMPLHLAALRGHTAVCRYILHQVSPRDANQMLHHKDKNGRTAHALAVHKGKPTVAATLQEYMEQYSAGKTWDAVLRRQITQTARSLCSVHSWKVWMGMPEVDDVDESPKFPFYYVIAIFGANIIYFFSVFLPVFHVQSGLLWDWVGVCSIMFALMIGCLYSFVQTWRTNPGRLDKSDDKIGFWRRLYEETLESYADDTGTANNEYKLALCHTCHIARPPRSKHDRFTRVCTKVFDHHCPFVGATVGLYNYRYFLSFLLTMTLYFVGMWVLLVVYVQRSRTMPWLTFLTGVYLAIHILFPAGMLFYHVQLIYANLTTNEHMNLRKYDHFWEVTGDQKRFRNPFDKGVLGNLQDRIFPTEESYLLPEQRNRLLRPQLPMIAENVV